MSVGHGNWVVPVVTGIAGSLVTAVAGIVLWFLNRGKYQAETERIEAETDDLTSARLIRELDRLSKENELMGAQIEKLRRDVIEYAKRETAHVIEIESLKLRVAELSRGNSNVLPGVPLNQIFPTEIPHVPGEFDEPTGSGSQ